MFINQNQKNFRVNYGDYLPLWAKVSYKQLALYGVHIGHSVNNLTLYSSWMVLGSRQGLCLINMFKFMYMFRGGLFIMQALIRRRSPIWFINLDQSSQSIIKSAALECGEYWVNDNWINGLLTNFRRITKAARRTLKAPRIMWTSRQHILTQNFRHWSLTRYTWPRGVFVSNVLLSYNVCQEAMNLRIPTIGIVDTNSPQKYVNIAVPGNDESFSSVGFYNNLMSMFIIYNKFSMVNLWYINKLSYVNKNVHTYINNTVFSIKNYYTTNSHTSSVNLNDFVFTSPVSNIKYGTLHHYQDIWKTRGVQFMYDLSKPSKLVRKTLAAHIKSFYNKNQVWLYTLRNIYKYNKKWARSLKIRRKNRKFKVRIYKRKGSKLYKHAWRFFNTSRVRNTRLLRTQTFNFWKSIFDLPKQKVPRNLMQIYRRYLRRVYWFPKSQYYLNFRSNIFNLLSTWFFVQFSRKRSIFSRFFHNSSKMLTETIKQRRLALRRLEGKQIRKFKRSKYVFSRKNLPIKSHRFINKFNDFDDFNNNEISVLPSLFQMPWANLPKNVWYFRVMGLRYSVKKNVFLVNKINLPLKLFNNMADKDSLTQNSQMNLHADFTGYNCCIKYTYNEWTANSINSKINHSSFTNYYYNNNVSMFKPLSSSVFINSFSGQRTYYIE